MTVTLSSSPNNSKIHERSVHTAAGKVFFRVAETEAVVGYFGVSSDMVNWSYTSVLPPVVPQFLHSPFDAYVIFVFNDRLFWIFNPLGAGMQSSSTQDGVSWQYHGASNFPYAASQNATSYVQMGAEIWIMGFNFFGIPSIYKSSDGISFSATATNLSSGTFLEMFLLGGTLYGFNTSTRVFRTSVDGVTWSSTIGSIVPTFANVISSGTEAFAIAGLEGGVTTQKTYRSVDAITWTQLNPAASFSARKACGAVLFGSQLHALGGLNQGDARLFDVWRYSAGITQVPL